MIAGVRGGRALARLLIVVGLFVAWELAPLVGLVDPRLLPRATTVFATLADLLSSAGFRKGLWITLAETGVSFMIAVPLGFLLGILIAESRYMTAVLRPLIFFIFSIIIICTFVFKVNAFSQCEETMSKTWGYPKLILN